MKKGLFHMTWFCQVKQSLFVRLRFAAKYGQYKP